MLNNNVVPTLSQDYEIQANGAFRRAWWAQDGAPSHPRIIVRDRRQELFRNRVIAFGHLREWPPRSPDLTPCDFFLWGYLKSRVYQTPPQNLEDLRNRITAEVLHCRETWFAEPWWIWKLVLACALSEMAHTSRDDKFFDVLRHCTLCEDRWN